MSTMELSQFQLANLLIGGIPVGIVLNSLYALTDIGFLRNGIVKMLLQSIKDFTLMLAAGLTAVIFVYYINGGEVRCLVVIGVAAGYILSHFTLEKLILRVRSIVLRALFVPITWIWSATFGILFSRVRQNAMVEGTEQRAQLLMLYASYGFENERRVKDGTRFSTADERIQKH